MSRLRAPRNAAIRSHRQLISVSFDHMILSELHMVKKPDYIPVALCEYPQGEIEEELALIWSEVLKVSPIGRNDSFFELGGDSLLATAIIHKIQDNFGVELPIRAVFELQTIKALAEEIDNIYSRAIEEITDDSSI